MSIHLCCPIGCYCLSTTYVPESTESSQLLYLITSVLIFPLDICIKKRSVLWLKPLEEALKVRWFLKWERHEVGTVLGPHYSLENLVFICEITRFHVFYKT